MATMSHGLTNREDWDEQYSAVTDQVYIRDLAAVSKVGVDIWGRPTTQPIKVTMIMRLDDEFDSTAEKDELDGTTVNYSRLSKQVREAIERKPDDCTTLMEFTSWITSQVKMIMAVAVAAWTIEVDLPKASALGSAIRCRVDMGKEDISTVSTNTLHLENITVPTIVGIHPHERTMKQPIVANVWLGPLTDKAPPDQYYEIEQIIVKVRSHSSLVRFLATRLARVLKKISRSPKKLEMTGDMTDDRRSRSQDGRSTRSPNRAQHHYALPLPAETTGRGTGQDR